MSGIIIRTGRTTTNGDSSAYPGKDPRESSPSAGARIPSDIVSLGTLNLLSELDSYLKSLEALRPADREAHAPLRTYGLIRELTVRCGRPISPGDCKLFVNTLSRSIELLPMDRQRSENVAHGLERIASRSKNSDKKDLDLMRGTANYILQNTRKDTLRNYANAALRAIESVESPTAS